MRIQCSAGHVFDTTNAYNILHGGPTEGQRCPMEIAYDRLAGGSVKCRRILKDAALIAKTHTSMPTITITTNHPASKHGVPVALIDGEPVSDRDGLKAALKALGWSMRKAARETGKTVSAFDNYIAERAPVPAEVWNRLRDALGEGEK